MDLRYETWKERRPRGALPPGTHQPGQLYGPGSTLGIRTTLDDVASRGFASLVDARTPEEFRGEVEMDHRPGHIPGACQHALRRPRGCGRQPVRRSRTKLRKRLAEAGIAEGEPVIAYCRSGIRAAVTWLALEPG